MYTILTDSCSDLNAEVAAKFDHFEVIPLSYTISGETSFQPFDDAQRCAVSVSLRPSARDIMLEQPVPKRLLTALKAGRTGAASVTAAFCTGLFSIPTK